jgi:hypothetical protein
MGAGCADPDPRNATMWVAVASDGTTTPPTPTLAAALLVPGMRPLFSSVGTSDFLET